MKELCDIRKKNFSHKRISNPSKSFFFRPSGGRYVSIERSSYDQESG